MEMKFKLFIIISSIFLISCREMKEIKVTSVEGFYVNKLTVENIDAEFEAEIAKYITPELNLTPNVGL